MRLGHGNGIDHAYITGKTMAVNGHGYIVAEPAQHTAVQHPRTDSVANITKNYQFADGDSWEEVRDNYNLDHPKMQKMKEDIRQNGIKKPIAIDYEQSPPKVLDGHTRLVHAESLGMKHVPVRHVEQFAHTLEEADPEDSHYVPPREQPKMDYEGMVRNDAVQNGHELTEFSPHPKMRSMRIASCKNCGATAVYSEAGRMGGTALGGKCGGRTAARWLPHERLFGPTQGLDHRLFDGDHLKPDVRKYILETLYDFWKPLYGADFDEWSIVYFAGSEASEWTSSTLEGNNDFDVLIGVDYVKMRGYMARTDPCQLMSDQEITDVLNREFKVLDEKTAQAMIPIDGEMVGPFSNTWYVNPHSYDIRAIKPYAAYDVTHDEWAVRPPALPEWDIAKFPEGPALVQECQAVASYVRSILKMSEPYRTQQGYALWQHLHGDRSRAFSDQGEGWFDPGNVIEKWLDQEGLWEKLVQIMVRAKSDPTTLNAPANWSNDPLSQVS